MSSLAVKSKRLPSGGSHSCFINIAKAFTPKSGRSWRTIRQSRKVQLSGKQQSCPLAFRGGERREVSSRFFRLDRKQLREVIAGVVAAWIRTRGARRSRSVEIHLIEITEDEDHSNTHRLDLEDRTRPVVESEEENQMRNQPGPKPCRPNGLRTFGQSYAP